MFKSSKEGIQEGNVSMSPGIHDNVHLTGIKAHTHKDKKDREWQVLDITFKNAKKEIHTHRIFNPAQGDQAKLEDNATTIANQLSYIATKLQGKDAEVEAESWEDLCNWAIENIPTNKVPLKVKLLGNVYNGQANVQITKYTGWLKTMASGETIRFSKKENEANAAYFAFMKPAVSNGVAPTKPDDLPF